MPLQPIPMGTKSAKNQSPTVSTERLVNCYAEPAPSGSKSVVVVHGSPGLKLWSSGVGSGPCRGMIKFGSYVYVASGNELYRVDSAKNAVLLGNIWGSTGHVQMIKNATQVGVLTLGEFYSVQGTSMTAVGLSGYQACAYQDGYGMLAKKNSEQWQLTEIDDFLTFNALDFSSADRFGDNLVGILSDHGEVWLFGEESTEVWANTGNPFFPFGRVQTIERGGASPHAASKDNNSVFWLGNDGKVYEAPGYSPGRISTPEVERLIAATGQENSAVSFIYDHGGSKFYSLTIGSKLTVEYNLTTGLWHERESTDIDRWRAQGNVTAFGKRLVGDYSNGNIYELDENTYDENGARIRREMTLPPLFARGGSATMARLLFDNEPGHGLDGSVQGSAPQVMLDWSDDGGRTWSNEIWSKAGEIGEWEHRPYFNRLGRFRNRTLRFSMSDPVKWAVSGVYADIGGRLAV